MVQQRHCLLFISEEASKFRIMSKYTLMKKLIDEQNAFRSEVMVRKEFNDEIQGIISYINTGSMSQGDHILAFWQTQKSGSIPNKSTWNTQHSVLRIN